MYNYKIVLKIKLMHCKLRRFEYRYCKAPPTPSMVKKSKQVLTERQNYRISECYFNHFSTKIITL